MEKAIKKTAEGGSKAGKAKAGSINREGCDRTATKPK